MHAYQSLLDLHHCLLETAQEKIRHKDEKANHIIRSFNRVDAAMDLLKLGFPGLEETDDNDLAGKIVGSPYEK
jgi:hypothetical protein